MLSNVIGACHRGNLYGVTIGDGSYQVEEGSLLLGLLKEQPSDQRGSKSSASVVVTQTWQGGLEVLSI